MRYRSLPGSFVLGISRNNAAQVMTNYYKKVVNKGCLFSHGW